MGTKVVSGPRVSHVLSCLQNFAHQSFFLMRGFLRMQPSPNHPTSPTGLCIEPCTHQELIKCLLLNSSTSFHWKQALWPWILSATENAYGCQGDHTLPRHMHTPQRQDKKWSRVQQDPPLSCILPSAWPEVTQTLFGGS